jgi:hypothetical protein
VTAASQCESRPCFSPSVAGRAFTPAMHHSLGMSLKLPTNIIQIKLSLLRYLLPYNITLLRLVIIPGPSA